MDRATKITQGTSSAEFKYAPDGARYRQVVTTGDTGRGPRTVYYLDKDYELTVWGPPGTQGSDLVEKRSFLGPVVVLWKGSTTTPFTREERYPHVDHQGSVDAVTDAAGVEYADANGRVDSHGYDAFGGPRARDWKSSGEKLHPYGEKYVTSTRGFTGHEHLDVVSIIHMNGRVYDYRLGRFLSVDPFISNPLSSQAINPYSYIGNNPLSGTDPTGYMPKGNQAYQPGIKGVDPTREGWSPPNWSGDQPIATPAAAGSDQNTTAGQAVIAASRSNGNGTATPRPGSAPHDTGSPGQLAQGAAISTGTQAASDAAVRARYEEAASKLDQNDPTASQQRRLLRTEARGQTSPAGAVIAEEMRPAGEAPRPGGRVATTNSTVNSTMDVAGKAGAVLMVVGAGVTVYNIASAPEGQTARVAAQEGGAWAGALSFGAAGGGMGAKAGAGVGVWFGGAGAVPGAAIGGFVGSIVGGAYGAYLGRQAADNVFDMTTRP